MSPTPTFTHPPEPQRSGLMTALVAGAIIALVAANIYLYVQIDHVRTDMAKMQESLKTDISNLKDANSVTSAAQQRHLEAMKEELQAARAQAQNMSSQAKQEALARADLIQKNIQAEEAKMRQQVDSQFSQVKQESTATNAKIADVSTDVGTVKTAQASTQAQLDKTVADLKSVTGDLGVASGLIATNGKELSALKARGERNYFDVKLAKTKQPVRVGDIMMRLDKADPKHNKYSVYIIADDKQVDKKDKNLNEPVQFYVAKGGHTPYELVINTIQKDQIVGYLATPKEVVSR